MTALALYATVYPGVEAFLADWYRSVERQTDHDFQLWIGVDALAVDAVRSALGADPAAIWVMGEPGDTPALIRQRAFERIVSSHDAVVLVDSDDVLHPLRVAAARDALRANDLTACALRLVDAQGADMGLVLGAPRNTPPEDVLPRHNVFGLSNSAFRCSLLRECLPIPRDVALVDWFLATRAWLLGAKLGFDAAIRMDYRQHGANMARTRPPFSREQVIEDTEHVRNHFALLRAAPVAGARPDRLVALEHAAEDVGAFHLFMRLHPMHLDRYVEALNQMGFAPVWWSSVAHPALRHLWMPARNPA